MKEGTNRLCADNTKSIDCNLPQSHYIVTIEKWHENRRGKNDCVNNILSWNIVEFLYDNLIRKIDKYYHIYFKITFKNKNKNYWIMAVQ